MAKLRLMKSDDLFLLKVTRIIPGVAGFNADEGGKLLTPHSQKG